MTPGTFMKRAGQPLRALLDVPSPRDPGAARDPRTSPKPHSLSSSERVNDREYGFAALRAEVIAALDHSELIS